MDNLIQNLTLEEKASLLGYQSKEISRLNIPNYNWWNEALHGVARAGKATVFPQSIAMAASFNNKLLFQVADAISTEARAKNNLAVAKDRRLQYMGLTFWSPNINIFRDPRWGRGHETYGEDPFLTAQMGIAFVQGLQGNDPKYLKTAACAKHFAVHSGPESIKHGFSATVSNNDLRNTYLYAFKKLVDAGVESVMCAYNRVNDEPCCTGKTLLQDILRNEWQFKGHVVTDCWALQDIYTQHKTLPNSIEVAAAAIKAGVNMDCSNLLQTDVIQAIKQNKISKKELDNALKPILKTQLKLGFFDKDKSQNPFSKYGLDSISNDYHKKLSLKMAEESMVLLKNTTFEGHSKPILPLSKEQYKAIMVVGPNAASLDALVGNYHGVSDKAVNFVEGITAAVSADTRVEYDLGCDFNDISRFGGTWGASNADVTVAVIGFNPVYEGEDGDAFLADGHGDRKNMSLPASHVAYIKALRKATKTPLIAVITGGSAVDLSEIEPYVDAIVLAWYPGEQGGTALANILFGDVSPSGHLPITFYNSFNDLPDYKNYNMNGRTYRYFDQKVQYPFGFGLSYTKFDYKWKNKPNIRGKNIIMEVEISNIGSQDAKALLQVYVKYPENKDLPIKELKAFSKTTIKKGENNIVEIQIPISELEKWNDSSKSFQSTKGNYKIIIGEHAQDEKLSFEIELK